MEQKLEWRRIEQRSRGHDLLRTHAREDEAGIVSVIRGAASICAILDEYVKSTLRPIAVKGELLVRAVICELGGNAMKSAKVSTLRKFGAEERILIV